MNEPQHPTGSSQANVPAGLHDLADATPPERVGELPGSHRSPLTPLALLKHSSKLSGANLISVLVGFPVSLLAARVLGPELLGVVGYVLLWQFYASLAKPGIFSAAYREAPPLLALGKRAEATRLLNLGITSEGIYVSVAIGVLVGAGLFQHDSLLRRGFLVGAAAFGVAQMYYFASQVQWAHRRFGLVARANGISGVATSVFTLAAVWWLKAYALLLAPAFGAALALLACRVWAGPSTFRVQFDWNEVWRLLKIGIPLALGTVFYWGFRTVDRTAVAGWLTLSELGYFTFVMQFVNLAISMVSDFGNVMQPILWAEMGRATAAAGLRRDVRRLALVILLVTCMGANLAQAGFGALVHWIAPSYMPAVPVFEILAFLIACGTAAFVPSLLLTSAAIGKQNQVMLVWGASLPVSIGLTFGAIRGGFGLLGIAAASVLAQLTASTVLLRLARPHLFGSTDEQRAFYGSMVGLLLTSFSVFAASELGPLTYTAGHSILRVVVTRLLVACIVWATAASVSLLIWKRSRSRSWQQKKEQAAEGTGWLPRQPE